MSRLMRPFQFGADGRWAPSRYQRQGPRGVFLRVARDCHMPNRSALRAEGRIHPAASRAEPSSTRHGLRRYRRGGSSPSSSPTASPSRRQHQSWGLLADGKSAPIGRTSTFARFELGNRCLTEIEWLRVFVQLGRDRQTIYLSQAASTATMEAWLPFPPSANTPARYLRSSPFE